MIEHRKLKTRIAVLVDQTAATPSSSQTAGEIEPMASKPSLRAGRFRC